MGYLYLGYIYLFRFFVVSLYLKILNYSNETLTSIFQYLTSLDWPFSNSQPFLRSNLQPQISIWSLFCPKLPDWTIIHAIRIMNPKKRIRKGSNKYEQAIVLVINHLLQQVTTIYEKRIIKRSYFSVYMQCESRENFYRSWCSCNRLNSS